MSTPTVRISKTSHRLLGELAKRTGQTMVKTLEKALDTYRRQVFFEKLNAGYAALRADTKGWAEEMEERKLWEATLMDGLDSEETWSEAGRTAKTRKKKP